VVTIVGVIDCVKVLNYTRFPAPGCAFLASHWGMGARLAGCARLDAQQVIFPGEDCVVN